MRVTGRNKDWKTLTKCNKNWNIDNAFVCVCVCLCVYVCVCVLMNLQVKIQKYENTVTGH